MMIDRKALRRQVRADRAAFLDALAAAEPASEAGARRLALEEALADHLIPRLAGRHIIGGYHATEAEIDPTPLLRRLADEGHVIGFPWFAGREAAMLFRAGPDRAVGPYGVDQPSAHAPEVKPDVLLMPLVAADRHGNRLGQGGGHYDRVLEIMRASGPVMAVGLAWDVQIVEALPAEPWDQPLDLIATPSGLIEVTP